MASIDIQVPDIGDFDEVTVIELMVKVGDAVKADQSLITVESDKASMEIPSSAAGVVKEIKVKLGDKVKQGSPMLVLEAAGDAVAAGVGAGAGAVAAGPGPGLAPAPAISAAASEVSAAAASVPAPRVDAADVPNVPVALVQQAVAATVSIANEAVAPATATAVPAQPAQPSHIPGAAPVGLPHASPSVRKFARELGVPLVEVKGSGLKGRITEADVQAFTRSVMSGAGQTLAGAAQSKAAGGGDGAAESGNAGAALGLIPWPKVDFAKFGPIERKEMSRIKKISGANLLRNAILIPAVTNHDDADITDLEAFRVSTNLETERSAKAEGRAIKVTMLAFLIKACVAALKKYPEFNSSLDDDAVVFKNYWNIGFAADTPNGLMVPVIKDADKKGIFQISQEMGDLAKKARDGKLSPTEMSGATFTISSLGGIGGRYFTPIINAPEVAILGVCRSTMQPVWDATLNGGAFVPRLMLPLSLTWDHRVIDGAAAARFNVYLGQILGDFRRVLL